jgi:hypothetical protein
MAEYTNISSKSKVNEDVVGFMARERDSGLPYNLPESVSGLEEKLGVLQ